MDYTAIQFDNDGGISAECDNYAYMHSGAFKDIVGKRQLDYAKNRRDGICYLKISRENKSIYLRYRAWSRVHKGEVMLSYVNRCRLGIVNVDKPLVKIKKSGWWRYSAFNRDSTIRFQFWMTVFAIFLTIIGIILSILN